MKRKTTEEFIIDAYCKHSDRYNYKLVDYKNNRIKVKIICHIHGIFEQMSGSHLKGQGCPKCAGNIKKSTEEFIEDAYCKHGDRYNYKLVKYINAKTKVKIICPEHGIFKQMSGSHLKGNGCPKCGVFELSNKFKKTTQQFIEDAYCIHGDKYNYSLVQYRNNKTKVKIICHKHGIFKQTPNAHLQGNGCPKCGNKYNGIIYAKNNIPVYNTYTKQLKPYGIACRRNKEDNNVLEVKCMYCDRWHIPTMNSIQMKIQCINGKQSGERNLYCSNECKQACPTYRQILYPKGYKTNTSREVQPVLRKCVLKRDNYTCQKCGAIDVELHCHHYEGIEVNPIESADADNCITLCKACHNEIHKADKCGIKQYQRKECKEGGEG